MRKINEFKNKPHNFNDLTGQKFGRLTIKKYIGSNKHQRSVWLCKCECGNEITTTTSKLMSGNTKSCGCLLKDILTKRNIKHGMSNTRFYQCWRDMLDRTTREKNCHYDRYGGRGIKVCERWNKFENFMEDMYKNYKRHFKKHGGKDTTLDRINNDGNYCIENCRWATRKEQNLNKSDNKKYEINGEKLTQKEISEKYNLSYGAIKHRFQRGWKLQNIIKPVLSDLKGENNSNSKLNKKEVIKIRNQYNEGNITYNELAKKYNVARQTIGQVVRKDNWKHI